MHLIEEDMDRMFSDLKKWPKRSYKHISKFAPKTPTTIKSRGPKLPAKATAPELGTGGKPSTEARLPLRLFVGFVWFCFACLVGFSSLFLCHLCLVFVWPSLCCIFVCLCLGFVFVLVFVFSFSSLLCSAMHWFAKLSLKSCPEPVSYTHLTLPTILLV